MHQLTKWASWNKISLYNKQEQIDVANKMQKKYYKIVADIRSFCFIGTSTHPTIQRCVVTDLDPKFSWFSVIGVSRMCFSLLGVLIRKKRAILRH